MSQNVSYHYVLCEILPTFATFTNEFSSILRLLSSPTSYLYLQTSSFHQTLLLTSKTPSFTLLFHLLAHTLPPPTSPPVEMSNFHLPRLCIPPEGRLSSFPISSRSLSPFSFHSVSLILSITCVPTHTEKTNPLRHTLPCHLSTLSARMEGNFHTYLPTAHFFMSDPTAAESAVPQPSISPPISRKAARLALSHS